jgi:hypothetical protein
MNATGPCRKAQPGAKSPWLSILALVTGLAAPNALAFPPAPHHLIFGMVRDEFGSPITAQGARVVLETSSGTVVSAEIIPDLEAGVNYRLEVPMDSGLKAGRYKATALQPTVPFRLKVRIGANTFLPIEMNGDFAKLGQPGKRTKANLTLGEDSDGDGLPDAWERLINPDITQVNASSDSDGDGLSNVQEYVAGTYAFDPADGFKLDIVRRNNGLPVLEFLALTGRTYTVEGSADLKSWSPLQFRIPSEGAATTWRQSVQSTDVRRLQVEVFSEASAPEVGYFRLIVH